METVWGGPTSPVVRHLPEASVPLIFQCKKLRVPLSTVWPPLWVFLRDLVLSEEKGERIWSWVSHVPNEGQGEVEDKGGWNDTSLSGSFLPSFLLPTFFPKKRKKQSGTIWVPQAELTNSFRTFKTTFPCKFTLPTKISPVSPSLLVLFSDCL